MKILSTIEHFRYKLVIPVINLFEIREKSISPVGMQARATLDPPGKRHYNGVFLAGR